MIIAALAVAVVWAAFASTAVAQNWPDFKEVAAVGLTVTPFLQNGVTGYTFAFEPGATVNGNPVDRIFGVYAVGQPKEATFSVTGSNFTGWTYASQSWPGPFAGWAANSPSYHLDAGDSVAVNFTTFNITSGSALPGYFLSYYRGPVWVCEYVKVPTPPTEVIPEPTALMLALVGGGASGAVTLLRRRLAR